jgi:hypothetical protein
LATIVVAPISAEVERREERRRGRPFAVALITALSALALGVSGYHPFAEDGGLYMAGIKRMLDPTLYPHGTEFVLGHLRFSMFAPMVAGLVRASHLSLEMVLLGLHVVCICATLFAGWELAGRCYAGRVARIGATTLLAIWIALPVAGTSLMLMDPYVTARSISTPCGLLALVGLLEFLTPQRGRWRGFALCCGALLVAAMMHPLMAAYALGCVMALGCLLAPSRSIRVWGTLGLCCASVALAAVLHVSAPSESGDYVRVAMTRVYWFPSEWHWYEQVGLIAPLIIVAVVAFGRRREGDAARVSLARMAVAAGVTAVVVAALFARTGLATHMVARLQPLRIFQIVYVVMILAVGATLAERVLHRRKVAWVAAFGLLAGVMVFAERQTFPESAHIELPKELPWSTPKGEWEKAFAWISRNTPKDALFAVDADYITKPGEDAQCFRAIAERSVLPDYSKDGGETAIAPKLTAAWAQGEAAQARLSEASDARRLASLRPLGVTWLVLERDAVTGFGCDYVNGAVKVCRLP